MCFFLGETMCMVSRRNFSEDRTFIAGSWISLIAAFLKLTCNKFSNPHLLTRLPVQWTTWSR